MGVEMTEDMPPITVARRDHARLERLAVNALRERHPVSGFLLSGIRRAMVCDANKMPYGVARLNEWVTYRIDGSKQTESKIVVCPNEFRNAQISLSVLSSLGAAVLGMSVGNCIKFVSIEGGLHCVIVEDVVAPPGAPLSFSLKVRSEASQFPREPRGPDDEGPKAA